MIPLRVSSSIRLTTYGLGRYLSLKSLTVTGNVAENNKICRFAGKKRISCSTEGWNSGDRSLSACQKKWEHCTLCTGNYNLSNIILSIVCTLNMCILLCSMGTSTMKPYMCRAPTLLWTLLKHFSYLSSIIYRIFNLGHLLGTSITHILHFYYTFFVHITYLKYLFTFTYISKTILSETKKCHQNINLYKTMIGLNISI